MPDVLASMVADRSVALISDSNVMPLHGAAVSAGLRASGLRCSEHVFAAGEASKNRKTWSILTDEMLAEGHGRDSVVVGVGGGVTTDLAGFVAATFMRGVPIIQLPTSALAMIDASVGGKTGVDVRAGKNLVGAFHRPAVVLVDVDTIATLPRAERGEGLVEAAKHGAILDVCHFEALEREVPRLLEGDPGAFAELVLGSVALKAGVVDQDEFESGYRQVLNFGQRLGVTEAGTAERLQSLLMELVGSVQSGLSPEEVEPFLDTDKKVRGGRARYVLLDRLGQVRSGDGWTHEVPAPMARAALNVVLSGDVPGPDARS
jgi:3-dehydroquinate synthase